VTLPLLWSLLVTPTEWDVTREVRRMAGASPKCTFCRELVIWSTYEHLAPVPEFPWMWPVQAA